MDASVLVLVIVGVVLAVGAVVMVLPTLQLRSRAKRDFRNARGTQHRRYIEQALAAVRTRIATLQADVRQLDDRVAMIERDELSELDQALARYLVATRLDDVPGVGPSRVRAILDAGFRGELSDLHTAHTLESIGPKTQNAISAWVREMQGRWPRLRNESFPGKQQILDRNAPHWRDLEQRRATLSAKITSLQALERQAGEELVRLSAVTVADFRRALTGRRDASGADAIRRYLLGTFAPWSMVPSWYADLLTAAEGEGAGGRAA